ncbi:MAG TPA: GNAT family N-acetyltransferase [Lacipirellulaceae bacterium]|nr:GNAT family N-acetyltransferase [Lacipirellulaceae bacterium]
MDRLPPALCPVALRASALRALAAARDSSQQDGLRLAIDSSGEAAWAGLIVDDPADPQAAVWVQATPGNTAVVWPPLPAAPAAAALLRAAAEFVDGASIALAQIIVANDDGYPSEIFAEAGFPKLANLRYLYADTSARGDRPFLLDRAWMAPSAPLEFHPHGGADAALQPLIERTYIGSQDCPALDAARTVADVVAGYRCQGEHMPQHWYVVTTKEPQRRHVGVLLLADHPSANNWELVYMGVVPEERGRRHGESIVRFALDAAGRAGAQRVVLAVDAANGPALEMYRRAGFSEWDQRTVYARLAGSPAPAART